MSSFSPDRTLCKHLFGRANRCAYPDCDRPLVAEHRGALSVNVEIAHIRSRSRSGPRYDESWPLDQIDVEANLLLLCFEHHKWVDEHPTLYSADELLAWKKLQVEQASKIDLTDAQVDRILHALTTPQAAVEVVGIVAVGAGLLEVPFGAVGTAEVLNGEESGRYIGIRVTNRGAAPFDVDTVGLKVDMGAAEPVTYQFPTEDYPGRPPKRLLPQSNAVWIAHPPTISAALQEVIKAGPYVPLAFQAYAHLGSGPPLITGPWLAAEALGLLWKAKVAQEWLEDMHVQRLEWRRAVEEIQREITSD